MAGLCGVLLDRDPAGRFVAGMQAPAQRSSDAKQKTARKRARRDADGGAARRAVVILGMHRSGTSALTGVLGLAGAGLPANLMPATPANPRGYFESQLLYELHEEIFAEAGVTWQDLLPPPPDWFRSGHAARFVDRLCKALREEFGDAPLLVLKDPRMCRLVPLWARVFQRLAIAPCYVLAIRHPLEVAASLEREHQMDERKATLLWLDHLLRAEHDTRGQRRSVVSYEHLLADWRGTIARIGADLDLPFPRLSRRTEAEIDEFLSSKLRHHGADRDALVQRRDVAGWVKDAYEWAQRASAGENPGIEVLDAAADALLGAERAFGPLLAAAELARARASEEVQKLTRAIDEWRTETRRRDGEVARLGEELRGAEKQISIGAGDVDRLREELALRQHHLERIVDWVKVLLQWTAQVTTGRAAPPQSLEVVFRALDTAAPAQLAAVATSGLEVAVHSAEAASLREQLAMVMAESRERAEVIGALQAECDALRGVAAESSARAAALGELQAECDVLRRSVAEAEQRAEAAAALQAECESLRSQTEVLEEKIGARNRETMRLDSESARLRVDLEIAGERLKREVAARAELEQRIESLRDHATELVRERGEAADRELAGLRAELETAGKRLKHEVAARAELEQRIASLRGLATELARARGEIADRALYIDQLKARVDEMERSLSWRAGRPARALARASKSILGR